MKSWKRLVVALACLVLVPVGAAAQSSIAGEVTDNTGGVSAMQYGLADVPAPSGCVSMGKRSDAVHGPFAVLKFIGVPATRLPMYLAAISFFDTKSSPHPVSINHRYLIANNGTFFSEGAQSNANDGGRTASSSDHTGPVDAPSNAGSGAPTSDMIDSSSGS